MCTIGNIFYTGRNDIKYNTIFKQCDLQDATTFISPAVNINTDTGIKYVPFTREKGDGTTPAWSGINEYGVSFVAADSYLRKNNNKNDISTKNSNSLLYVDMPKTTSVFDMYLDLIAKYKTAKEAADSAEAFYREYLKGETDTDILLVADATTSYFIEALAGNVICVECEKNFFASTNHMRMIYGAVDYANNHSTYLRLQRAEAILQSNPTHSGVGDLLRDKYYGQSVWSICRSNNIVVSQEAPFYTQASVIFNVPLNSDSSGLKDSLVEFVINGKPDEQGKGFIWRPFTSTYQTPVDYIGKGDI